MHSPKEYNDAVQELWNDYLKGNGIDPCKMTIDQAEAFLDLIKNTNSRRIKPFLKGISLAQKGIGPFLTLGAGLTSVDAAFRADPIGTLELITPDF